MVHYFPTFPKIFDYPKAMAYAALANLVLPPQSVATLLFQKGTTMVGIQCKSFDGLPQTLNFALGLNVCFLFALLCFFREYLFLF